MKHLLESLFFLKNLISFISHENKIILFEWSIMFCHVNVFGSLTSFEGLT
jgi:hypothetical protein